MCLRAQPGGVGRKSLYLLLHFAVNLKLLSENKSYWKKTKNKKQKQISKLHH